MNTVLAILEEVAKEPDGKPTSASVRRGVADKVGAGKVEQDFHLSLLESAGFIRFEKQSLEMQRDNPLVVLTWTGHDLLDKLENQHRASDATIRTLNP